MKELIENIKGCPDSAMGIWVGSIYLGTVEDAQALVNAYTQLKADLATAKQALERYATQKDRTVRCGACGYENCRQANTDRAKAAENLMDAIENSKRTVNHRTQVTDVYFEMESSLTELKAALEAK